MKLCRIFTLFVLTFFTLFIFISLVSMRFWSSRQSIPAFRTLWYSADSISWTQSCNQTRKPSI